MEIKWKLFFPLAFLLVVGICAGAFFEINMTGNGKEQLIDITKSMFESGNTLSFLSSFLQGAKGILITVLLFYVSAFVPVLVPLPAMILLMKGISLGFSATMLMEAFGSNGAGYILFTLLPQAVMDSPIYCFLACFATERSFCCAKSLIKFMYPNRGSGKKTRPKNSVKQFTFISLAGFALLLIICLLEIFLQQLVI